jgi:hypothetical protein
MAIPMAQFVGIPAEKLWNHIEALTGLVGPWGGGGAAWETACVCRRGEWHFNAGVDAGLLRQRWPNHHAETFVPPHAHSPADPTGPPAAQHGQDSESDPSGLGVSSRVEGPTGGQPGPRLSPRPRSSEAGQRRVRVCAPTAATIETQQALEVHLSDAPGPVRDTFEAAVCSGTTGDTTGVWFASANPFAVLGEKDVIQWIDEGTLSAAACASSKSYSSFGNAARVAARKRRRPLYLSLMAAPVPLLLPIPRATPKPQVKDSMKYGKSRRAPEQLPESGHGQSSPGQRVVVTLGSSPHAVDSAAGRSSIIRSPLQGSVQASQIDEQGGGCPRSRPFTPVPAPRLVPESGQCQYSPAERAAVTRVSSSLGVEQAPDGGDPSDCSDGSAVSSVIDLRVGEARDHEFGVEGAGRLWKDSFDATTAEEKVAALRTLQRFFNEQTESGALGPGTFPVSGPCKLGPIPLWVEQASEEGGTAFEEGETDDDCDGSAVASVMDQREGEVREREIGNSQPSVVLIAVRPSNERSPMDRGQAEGSAQTSSRLLADAGRERWADSCPLVGIPLQVPASGVHQRTPDERAPWLVPASGGSQRYFEVRVEVSPGSSPLADVVVAGRSSSGDSTAGTTCDSSTVVEARPMQGTATVAAPTGKDASKGRPRLTGGQPAAGKGKAAVKGKGMGLPYRCPRQGSAQAFAMSKITIFEAYRKSQESYIQSLEQTSCEELLKLTACEILEKQAQERADVRVQEKNAEQSPESESDSLPSAVTMTTLSRGQAAGMAEPLSEQTHESIF